MSQGGNRSLRASQESSGDAAIIGFNFEASPEYNTNSSGWSLDSATGEKTQSVPTAGSLCEVISQAADGIELQAWSTATGRFSSAVPANGNLTLPDTRPEDCNFDADSFRVVHCRLAGPVPAQPATFSLTRWLASYGIGRSCGPAHNVVRTAKYTFLTFVPVNLFQQFSRVANFYFLIIATLQLIPQLSPTPWVTTVTPLVFVLVLNGMKELVDDVRRHKSDSEVNHRMVTVLRQDGNMQARWQDLRTGDVVKVMKDSDIPADLLFLAGSDKATDAAFLETSSLDGETNLKQKMSYDGTKAACTAADLLAFSQTHYVKCEKPNERLYDFDGTMNNLGGDAQRLEAANLLLRGCTLKNTDWVLGMVISAGTDTKIFRNRSDACRKVTSLEKNMNILVVVVFGLLLAISAACSIGNVVFLMLNDDTAWYMYTNGWWPELDVGMALLVLQFVRYFILLDATIPISLYVTLELVKLMQCMYLHYDRHMYDAASDTPFVYKTTTLNEDLGQIEYILSDKTGTLTQNIMGFVAVSIRGQVYGSLPDSATTCTSMQQFSLQQQQQQQSAQDHAPDVDVDVDQGAPHSLAACRSLRTLLNQNMRAALQSGPSSADATAAKDIMIALALCNTVSPQVSDDGHSITYQASSPDEEALVQGTSLLGFPLTARTHSHVAVEAQGATLEVKVLAVLEFTSDRKRMSVLARLPDGRVRLYTKGADTMLLPRLASGQEAAVATLQRHLADMARAGYRTLVQGYRDVPHQEVETWQRSYHEASTALEERADKLDAVAEKLEHSLQLLGATAVEDRLQEGVPSAIADLLAAGIRVWVLTGDKLETATSVGVACRLLLPSMHGMVLRDAEFAGVAGYDAGQQLQRRLQVVLAFNRQQGGSGPESDIALIVEGGALAVMLAESHRRQFLQLCQACKVVICCRVSPMQKAQVARLVKAGGHKVLCIGDGANDVSMIQAADVGCGISGREGRAAVLTSDYAFAQFRFLSRLLLVHGRWSFKRNLEIVCYSFYKNLVYSLPNVYFGYVSGFSAQPFFSTALMATFNICWTSWPSVGFATFDKDVEAETVVSNPWLYAETMRSGRCAFFLAAAKWALEAVWHSVVVLVVPLLALWAPDSYGKTSGGLTAFGTTAYTSIIFVVNLKVALRSSTLGWPALWMIGIISIGCFFPFLSLVSNSTSANGEDAELIGVPGKLFRDGRFWLALACSVTGSLMLDFVSAAFVRHFWPQDHQLLQEAATQQCVTGSESERLLSIQYKCEAAAAQEVAQMTTAPNASGKASTIPTIAELLQRQ